MPGERDFVDHVALAGSERHLILAETLALGLLVLRKWDRASLGLGQTAPTPADVAAFDHFTTAALSEFRGKAKALLDEHAILRRPADGRAFGRATPPRSPTHSPWRWQRS